MESTLREWNEAPPRRTGRSARRRRRERLLAITGLGVALAALPLPTHAHSPELAATLAIGALALLAGHRWGLAVLVIAEIFLIGAVWPLAFVARPPSVAALVAVTASCIGAVPGLLSLRSAAGEVLSLVGARRTRKARRVAHAVLVATTALVWLVPLI